MRVSFSLDWRWQCLFLLALITTFLSPAVSFPQYLASTHCGVSMEAGSVMMGVSVTHSDKRKVVVTVDGARVTAGESISSFGEALVSVEPRTPQVAFEVRSSTAHRDTDTDTGTDTNTERDSDAIRDRDSVYFDNGGCAHKQRTWKQGSLRLSGDKTNETQVTIVAVWGSSATLYRSPPFTFTFSPATQTERETKAEKKDL